MKTLAKFTRSILLGASMVGLVACGGAQKDTIKLAELKQDATPAEKAFHAGMKAYIAEEWKTASGHFSEPTSWIQPLPVLVSTWESLWKSQGIGRPLQMFTARAGKQTRPMLRLL